MMPAKREVATRRMMLWKRGIWPKEGWASTWEDLTSRLMLVRSPLSLGLCMRISALVLNGEIRTCNPRPSLQPWVVGVAAQTVEVRIWAAQASLVYSSAWQWWSRVMVRMQQLLSCGSGVQSW